MDKSVLVITPCSLYETTIFIQVDMSMDNI